MSFRVFLATSSAFLLTACGGSGGGAGVSLPSLSTPDTVPPNLTFSLRAVTVGSGQSENIVLTATDNLPLTTTPTLSCTNGGVFENNSFTAPTVTEETEVVCEASQSDSAGNTGFASFTATITPPPDEVSFAMTGSAFKGLILGGTVLVTDANNPDVVLGETTTSATDGRFALTLTYDGALDIDHLKVNVRGGALAQMICDAPAGCEGAAFGELFAIDETFGMSGIFGPPASGIPLTADLSILSDLAAALAVMPIDEAGLQQAMVQAKGVFGFDATDPTSPVPLDLTSADATGTKDSARLALVSGGLLQSLFETGQAPGVAYQAFKDDFQQNNGEIIVKEAVDDTALITLEEIYENIDDLKTVIAADTEGLDEAFADVEAELLTIDTDVVPDNLTTSGVFPLRDVIAPTLIFTPLSLSVISGESLSVLAEVSDADTSAALTAATCTGGTYDIGTQIYTAPADLFQATSFECSVDAEDASGNTGTGGFTVSILAAADTAAPTVNFNPNQLSLISGQSSDVELNAADNVGVIGDIDVSCTNGGRFENGVFFAPAVTVSTDIACTALASDAAGNSGSATLSVVVTSVPDTTPPEVAFSLGTLVLEPGESLVSVLTVSDNIGLAGDVSVVCTRGGVFGDNIFTAPSGTESLTSICTATATDTSGNTASATLAAVVTYVDREAPIIAFLPNEISLEVGETSAVEITASDNIAIDGAISITCTNGGVFGSNGFTAPLRTSDLTSICTAEAVDTSGNRTTATLTAQIAYVDRISPTVSFEPGSVTVQTGESVVAILSASDNVALEGNVLVVCSNGGMFANNMFTAPEVTQDTVSVCTATATDTSSNQATAELTAEINFEPDTENPVITINTAGPFALAGESSIPFVFTVTDNVAVQTTTVSCDSPELKYLDGQLTAEFTPTAFTDRCRINARDTSNNSSIEFFSVEVMASPDEPPVITFNPSTLILGPNGSGVIEILATDRHGTVEAGPNVSCTDGVTFIDNVVTAPDTAVDINSVCTATATDDQGLTGSAELNVSIKSDAGPPMLTGFVTFDRFGSDPDTGLIDDNIIVTEMAKGITVEVLNLTGDVISVASTDETGYYEAVLSEFGEVQARVATEIQQVASPENPITYQEEFNARPERSNLTEARFLSGLETRQDMHFGTTLASGSEIASNLNVLDVIYLGMQKVRSVDDTLIFPKLDINIAESGLTISDRYQTLPKNVQSHYTSTTFNDVQRRTIKIATRLYNADNSDLMDRHVIAHLWTHYLEDAFGRYDSPGLYAAGNVTDRNGPLDPRVAFSEGFANAMAGIILDDPIYVDRFFVTEGFSRFASASVTDLENAEVANKGWFSMASIQSIIWDLYDDTNETFPTVGGQMDTRSVGFEGIFNALRHPIHKDTKYFTTIYSFREALDVVTGTTEIGIFTNQSIFSRDALAESESNNGGDPLNLPIFSVKGNETLELCSNLIDPESLGYTLGIIKNVAFTVPENGNNASFTAISSTPFGPSEPEMIVYDRGVEVDRTTRDDAFGDTVVASLAPGDYMISIFDNDNFRGTSSNGSICMDLSGG